MERRKKILISVIYINDIGGIGTSITNLLNLIHNTYDITLIATSNFISPNRKIPDNIKILPGSNYLYDIVPDRSKLSGQSLVRKFIRNSRRIVNHFFHSPKQIEKALDSLKLKDEYDVAIAFTDFKYDSSQNKCYDYYFVKNCVRAKVKIAWIHNNAIELGWSKESIVREFQGFDKIVNVSKGCKSIFDNISSDFENKSKVVYNCYDIDTIKRLSESNIRLYEDNNKLHIVTVARMKVIQKRIDRVIETCKRLVENDITNFDWTLVGNGGDLPMFMESVRTLKLEEYIHFVGHKPNPFPYVKQADLFVQTSDYEGFGMTVKEAQILGVPTFVTNYIASDEVVENGVQGIICNNSVDGIYETVKNAILNPDSLKIFKDNLKSHPVSNEIALRQFECVCFDK